MNEMINMLHVKFRLTAKHIFKTRHWHIIFLQIITFQSTTPPHAAGATYWTSIVNISVTNRYVTISEWRHHFNWRTWLIPCLKRAQLSSVCIKPGDSRAHFFWPNFAHTLQPCFWSTLCEMWAFGRAQSNDMVTDCRSERPPGKGSVRFLSAMFILITRGQWPLEHCPLLTTSEGFSFWMSETLMGYHHQ